MQPRPGPCSRPTSQASSSHRPGAIRRSNSNRPECRPSSICEARAGLTSPEKPNQTECSDCSEHLAPWGETKRRSSNCCFSRRGSPRMTAVGPRSGSPADSPPQHHILEPLAAGQRCWHRRSGNSPASTALCSGDRGHSVALRGALFLSDAGLVRSIRGHVQPLQVKSRCSSTRRNMRVRLHACAAFPASERRRRIRKGTIYNPTQRAAYFSLPPAVAQR